MKRDSSETEIAEVTLFSIRDELQKNGIPKLICGGWTKEYRKEITKIYIRGLNTAIKAIQKYRGEES